MTEESTPKSCGGREPCSRSDCPRAGDLWVYDASESRWRPLCEPHTRRLHPSLELDAWLESGYAKPVELGRPTGRPADPPAGRPAAFRAIVDRAMGWT